MAAALPLQPLHVAVVLAGAWERPGWWGPGRDAVWADAVAAAELVASMVHVPLEVVATTRAPWHPGRCAELRAGGQPIGAAGELHPRVVETLGLPSRTCAMELALQPVLDLAPEIVPGPVVSAYPAASLDVALVVPTEVPVAEVAATLREGAGPLLEELHLFDVYAGDQVDAGQRSLAFRLRLRAADRTLTVDEAVAQRDAAVTLANERFGATLRS